MARVIDTEVELSLRDAAEVRTQLAKSAITTAILNHIATYGDPRAGDVAVKFKLKWMPADLGPMVESATRSI